MAIISRIVVTLGKSGWETKIKEIEVAETEKTFKGIGFRVLKSEIDVITDGRFRRKHNYYSRDCYTKDNIEKMCEEMIFDIKKEFNQKLCEMKEIEKKIIEK